MQRDRQLMPEQQVAVAEKRHATPPEYDRASPDRPLGLKMTVIARLMRSQFDRDARNIGITRTEWSTMTAVAGAEGCTQRVIAALLEVTEVTAGRMVDKLADEGLLERRLDPANRRAYRVYLTAKVGPILEQLRELGGTQETRALAGLTDAQLAQLNMMLDRIAANLNASFNDPPATIRRLIESGANIKKPAAPQ